MSDQVEIDVLLPESRRGRKSKAQRAEDEFRVLILAMRIRDIASGLDFLVSSRGWCHIL
jgi:hypothetical protein